MGSAADLMEKVDRARNSARMLLEAGDADGACNRGYYGLFLTARACLIAAGGTTGDAISGEKRNVIHALRGLIDEVALKEELFGVWIEAGDRRLQADLGQAVPRETARILLARIDTLASALQHRFPTDKQGSAAKSVLVLTTDHAAVGHLRWARIGTRQEAFSPTLIQGVLPQAGLYFAERAAPSQDEQTNTLMFDFHWFEASSASLRMHASRWPALRDLIAQHDRTELWVDPDANSQLVLLFLLDYLGDDSDTLWLYQSPTLLGGHPAEDSLTSVPPLRPIEPPDAVLASWIWRAYAAPTPERLPPFLQADLSHFPALHDTLLAVLEELPGLGDGLGATQRWMLRMVAQGAQTPRELFRAPRWQTRPPTYRYWEIGPILDDLCRCRRPAISGLQEGPFTLGLHDDPERHRLYFESPLVLTDYGRDLLAGKADFAAENRIDRYWGGTRLTNQSLWRWDSERRSLSRN